MKKTSSKDVVLLVLLSFAVELLNTSSNTLKLVVAEALLFAEGISKIELKSSFTDSPNKLLVFVVVDGDSNAKFWPQYLLLELILVI